MHITEVRKLLKYVRFFLNFYVSLKSKFSYTELNPGLILRSVLVECSANELPCRFIGKTISCLLENTNEIYAAVIDWLNQFKFTLQ